MKIHPNLQILMWLACIFDPNHSMNQILVFFVNHYILGKHLTNVFYSKAKMHYLNISVISAIASFDAVGMIEAKGVAENWGNLKFILAASLKPSGQSLLSGVPNTEQILKISSISELPGNRGL